MENFIEVIAAETDEYAAEEGKTLVINGVLLFFFGFSQKAQPECLSVFLL